MVENVIFWLSVITLLVIAAFVAYQVIKRSNHIEKTIEAMKSIQLAKGLLLILGVAFTFMAIIFIRYFTYFYDGLSDSNTDWGTFGDFIGGTLNPILSFLSLIALLTTIVLQSRELELTRDELKRSATAQEDTKKILAQQSETLARQQFESTLFSLFDQHNKLLEHILSPPLGNEEKKSRFDIIRTYVLTQKDLNEAKKALEKNGAFCSHYFRTLFQILKFIATNSICSPIGSSFTSDKIMSEPVTDQEKMYVDMIRSILSSDILHLLAIYCYHENNEEPNCKFKLLIERYAFFENMPLTIDGFQNVLIESLKDAYEESAFGQRTF